MLTQGGVNNEASREGRVQGSARRAYQWVSTILVFPLFLSAFLNYYNRFGVREEQHLVYVMDHVLGELTGLLSFSIAESVLAILAGLGCMAIWIPFGRLPNLFGLLLGASYFGVLTQYAWYAELPDQLAAFAVLGLAYGVTSLWGIWGMDVMGSGSRYPFLVGAGVIGVGLLAVSVRMALRAPQMEETFSEYRRYMEFTGLESPEELRAEEPAPAE